MKKEIEDKYPVKDPITEDCLANARRREGANWAISRGVAKEKCTACENHFINQELCPLCEVYRMKVK